MADSQPLDPLSLREQRRMHNSQLRILDMAVKDWEARGTEWETVIDYYRRFSSDMRIWSEWDRTGIVMASDIDDLAAALLRFTYRYVGEEGVRSSFVDLGCYDGRVVALASVLGYRSFGIEYDAKAFHRAKRNIAHLVPLVPSLQNVRIVRGDYLQEQSFYELRVEPHQVDVFFNYDDSNVESIGKFISRKGKRGSILLLQTQEEYMDDIPLKLDAMIKGKEDLNFDVYIN